LAKLQRNRKVAKKFGIPNIYDSVEKLLDNSPDIIDICTPPFTRCKIAMKIAEFGCPLRRANWF